MQRVNPHVSAAQKHLEDIEGTGDHGAIASKAVAEALLAVNDSLDMIRIQLERTGNEIAMLRVNLR